MVEVIKSAPKWHFLHVLDLDPHNQQHQAIYWLMKVIQPWPCKEHARLIFGRARPFVSITSNWTVIVMPCDQNLHERPARSPQINSPMQHSSLLSEPSMSRRALKRGVCTLVDHCQTAAIGSFVGFCTTCADTVMVVTKRRLSHGNSTTMTISTRAGLVSNGYPGQGLDKALLMRDRSVSWWCWWRRQPGKLL